MSSHTHQPSSLNIPEALFDKSSGITPASVCSFKISPSASRIKGNGGGAAEGAFGVAGSGVATSSGAITAVGATSGPPEHARQMSINAAAPMSANVTGVWCSWEGIARSTLDGCEGL